MSAQYSTPSFLAAGRRIATRWKPGSIVFLAMFGLVALIVWRMPDQYQSQVKILVKNARVNPMVSLDQQTQGVLYVDEVSEARINTEIELLTSTDVLRQVVARCHLGDLFNKSIHNPEARDNIALRQLQKDLVVSAVRKSDIIEVTYQSPDPRRSAAVVRTLSGLYLDAHLKLHGSPGSSGFFQQIANSYSNKLASAEAELAEFRQVHHIVALPEEKSLALEQTTDLEKSLAASSAAMRRDGEAANHLHTVVGTTPAMIETERRALPNQNSAEQLALLLLTLRNKRAEAVRKYMPDDRIVTELDAQIDQTEAALKVAQDGKAQEVTTGSNPTLLSAQEQYIRTSSNFDGNLAQTRQLAQDLKVNRARLVALDTATVPYEGLERRTKQLEDLTEFYKKKSEEAQVNDELDTQRISNVTIAEQPFQAEVPSSPKRGLILSLGFLWSLMIAIATAVVIDLFDERVSSPYELEQATGLPILAFLPSLALPPSFGGAFPTVYMSMQRRIVRSLP